MSDSCTLPSSSKCSIGKELQETCHKTIWANQMGISCSTNLDSETVLLLKLRSGVTKIHDVCYHHKEYFLKKYSMKQKKCCNPFGVHKKPSRGKL